MMGIMILLVTTMASMPKQALSDISVMMAIGTSAMRAKPSMSERMAKVPLMARRRQLCTEAS